MGKGKRMKGRKNKKIKEEGLISDVRWVERYSWMKLVLISKRGEIEKK